ncbi:Pyridoxine/pyridoxamine 5'-phosphate oxidase 2 [Quillaja saponaria]|uniref:pyridoxal 5'-phosphate synthase n=1 Tax=Quillaja saponaria TaxID=32244 RepID=A0AAD7LQP9_QUISA|nr:Pyridoxine/pyridoxamine 5'-phosphate oxidase 2 [Quillaja saponaria]
MGTVTAPWKQLLLNALESNAHLKHSSYFQLATIGSNGRPSNRTVVFRGFQDNSDKIQINTDGHTRKIEELKHCPFAEICWYFTDTWEQFRINGRIDIINGSNPDSLKLQQREKSWFAGPVDAFYLLVLDPDQIDYLNLKSNQRLTFNSRLSASGEKSWTSERINP